MSPPRSEESDYEAILSDPVSRRTFFATAGIAAGVAMFGIQAFNAEPALAAVATLWPNGSKARPVITSGFGQRDGRLHAGTDFVGFSTARSVTQGTVIATGVLSGWENGGNQVLIQHSGYTSRYLHLANNSITVANGQAVVAGSPIGTVGNTGNSQGTHLHLEINPGGGQVDPIPFLTPRIAGSTIPQPDSKDDMIIFIQGKAGARRGGYYAIVNGQGTFLGSNATVVDGVAHMTDDSAIAALQAKVPGLS